MQSFQFPLKCVNIPVFHLFGMFACCLARIVNGKFNYLFPSELSVHKTQAAKEHVNHHHYHTIEISSHARRNHVTSNKRKSFINRIYFQTTCSIPPSEFGTHSNRFSMPSPYKIVYCCHSEMFPHKRRANVIILKKNIRNWKFEKTCCLHSTEISL